MTDQPHLTERSQNILKATIKHYIATAEPVGSKTLAEEYNFKISSATIRNIMGRLEEAGLLYQPHVSAGRIPSDWGYRIYVDRLITPDEFIGKRLETYLQQQLQWQRSSFESLLQRTTKILAALSGYIALITFPKNPSNTLRHLQLVCVSPEQIMLVIVTDSCQTQSVLIEQFSLINEEGKFERELIESQLNMLSNFLNHKLKGKTLIEIGSLDWLKNDSILEGKSFYSSATINQEFMQYADLVKIIARELRRLTKPSYSTPIAIHGVAEVLRQPEFSQLQQVQTLLYLLEEEQEQLLPVMFTLPETSQPSKRVTIKIGSENVLEPMRSCTLVAANYYQDRVPVGSVGVIGPTRMLYENAITLVEATADYLSDTLS